jgi:N utilization substance protein B
MVVPLRRRTRARELALQFLYMMELSGESAMEELIPFVEHHTKGSRDTKGRGEVAEFTLALCRGVVENRPELDSWIEAIARNWRLDRMAHLDRNILRIAVFELVFQAETPYKVVINEAIDIAKRYSTSQSGSFVNGILDRARVLIEESRKISDGHPTPPAREELKDSPAPIAVPSRNHPMTQSGDGFTSVSSFTPPVPRARQQRDSN